MFVDLTEGGQKSLMKWNVGVVSGGREVGGEGPRCSSWKRRKGFVKQDGPLCCTGWDEMPPLPAHRQAFSPHGVGATVAVLSHWGFQG